MTGFCRICGAATGKDGFELAGMPAQAQFFPDASTVENDRAVDLILRECPCCGVVQLLGAPVPYWREVVRAAAYSAEMKDFRLKQFDSWLTRYALKGKKVLEAGCGRGEYLSLMQACGADAFGIEYGQASVAAAQKAGLDVRRHVFETGEESVGKTADGFFVLNWLEHLPDVRAFLNGVKNNTSEDAVGLIEVPNGGLILKNGLVFEITRDHLYYFTQDSLRRVLEMNGFDVLSLQTVWHDYILSAVVRKRAPADFKILKNGRDALSDSVRAFVSKYDTLAVWGAGHQALTALAALKECSKIAYVIDSAPFKQGRLTPVTHLPIVSPDVLKTRLPDAVLVAAAAYNDEIVAFLRQNYGEKFSVGVLTDAGAETVFEKKTGR